MLTRLKINGFKNLVDVDIRLGPFNCIAGANGVGKSNLFDAIMFLSALSDRTLIDAAKSVRDAEGRVSDIRALFHHVGDTYENRIDFEAELIVPEKGVDDLGQVAKATITFLRYKLSLGYKVEEGLKSSGGIELLHEELTHINIGDASKHLLFNHKASTWRRSAVKGERRGGPFISTETQGSDRIIKLHQDGGSSGRPRSFLAANLPRTILSSANAAESPTVLLAKRELQSWRLLQLEPSSLRRPDEINAPTKLGSDGSHLAATLYHLTKERFEEIGSKYADEEEIALGIYAKTSNRLAELVEDVKQVSVDYDQKRELLTVMVTSRDGTPHSARSLSDGTLRFLALAVLELDLEAKGVICLEEPENGIHPVRIPSMLSLLKDIATDVDEPIDQDNPLRQVIINTHSPVVVAQIPDESLIIADLHEVKRDKVSFKATRLSALTDTWRHKAPEGCNTVTKGKLLSYLNPVASPDEDDNKPTKNYKTKMKRVVDRQDLQELLPFPTETK